MRASEQSTAPELLDRRAKLLFEQSDLPRSIFHFGELDPARGRVEQPSFRGITECTNLCIAAGLLSQINLRSIGHAGDRIRPAGLPCFALSEREIPHSTARYLSALN